jgi:hypothetical protein
MALTLAQAARLLLRVRKVEAMREAPKRRVLGFGNPQGRFGDPGGRGQIWLGQAVRLWKLNPLADWDDKRLWNNQGSPSAHITHFTTRAILDWVHSVHLEAWRRRGLARRPLGRDRSDGVRNKWLAAKGRQRVNEPDAGAGARQASDFELLANGGFAPLGGFWAR